MAKDTDPFARWDAAQQLAIRLLLDWIEQRQRGQPMTLAQDFVDAFQSNLLSEEPDRALIAELLHLPGEAYVTEFLSEIDPDAVHDTRQQLRRALADKLYEGLLDVYERSKDKGPYRFDAESTGRRALKNLSLSYLGCLDDAQVRSLVVDQFYSSDNMTDRIAALAVLSNTDWPERKSALDAFYAQWQSEPLVLDKWFMIQAVSHRRDTLAQVRRLLQHPAFNIRNPNRVRALIGTFAHANAVRFHDSAGHGYQFIADRILELDSLNPQVAARLMTGFNDWRRYEPHRSRLMRAQIERVLGASPLSNDVREIAEKDLQHDN
jgi:aminopeptidase N